MVLEPLVVEKFLALEMTTWEESSNSRIASEDQLKDTWASTSEVIAENAPLSGDYNSLLLCVQNNIFVNVWVIIPGRRNRATRRLLTISWWWISFCNSVVDVDRYYIFFEADSVVVRGLDCRSWCGTTNDADVGCRARLFKSLFYTVLIKCRNKSGIYVTSTGWRLTPTTPDVVARVLPNCCWWLWLSITVRFAWGNFLHMQLMVADGSYHNPGNGKSDEICIDKP